jgi:hypothetical protein
LYFNFFSASFCTTFLSAGIATYMCVHDFSFFFFLMIMLLFYLLLLLLLLNVFILLRIITLTVNDALEKNMR